MKVTKKIVLHEDDMPKQWYNIIADMPHKPAPMLNPQTREPVSASDMYGLFAEELANQEFTQERFIDIPDEVRELYRIYREYYAEDSFVHVVDEPIDLKQVVNTNKCLLHLEKHGDKLLVVSCIDNLLKGASGTAVHNMNLLFNLKETTGLILKPSGF